MKILVVDTKIGAYEKEVSDNFFDAPEVEVKLTIEERIAALEKDSVQLKMNIAAKMSEG